MALSKEDVTLHSEESTNERGQKIRAHVHQMLRKLITQQAAANKTS